MNSNNFPTQNNPISGKLGGAFKNTGVPTANNLENFGKVSSPNTSPQTNNFNVPTNNIASQFPFATKFNSDVGNNNPGRKTFGAPFGKSQVIGPQNNPRSFPSAVENEVEVFSKVIFNGYLFKSAPYCKICNFFLTK